MRHSVASQQAPSCSTLFIGGTGRCGTNILKTLLGGDPASFALTFEPRYILDPNGLLDFVNCCHHWSPYNVDAAIQRLESFLFRLSRRSMNDRFFASIWRILRVKSTCLTLPQYAAWELDRHIPGFSENTKELLNNLRKIVYHGSWCGTRSFSFRNQISFFGAGEIKAVKSAVAKYIDANTRQLLELHNASRLIDDSTFSILHASQLKALIPTARFIHIYRDPRDVVTSYMMQRWAPSTIKDAVFFYQNVMSESMHQLSKIPKQDYSTVRYEKLVSSPDSVLSNLQDQFKINANGINTEILDGSNIGRWKTDLSLDQRNELTQLLSRDLDRYGYK